MQVNTCSAFKSGTGTFWAFMVKWETRLLRVCTCRLMLALANIYYIHIHTAPQTPVLGKLTPSQAWTKTHTARSKRKISQSWLLLESSLLVASKCVYLYIYTCGEPLASPYRHGYSIESQYPESIEWTGCSCYSRATLQLAGSHTIQTTSNIQHTVYILCGLAAAAHVHDV